MWPYSIGRDSLCRPNCALNLGCFTRSWARANITEDRCRVLLYRFDRFELRGGEGRPARLRVGSGGVPRLLFFGGEFAADRRVVVAEEACDLGEPVAVLAVGARDRCRLAGEDLREFAPRRLPLQAWNLRKRCREFEVAFEERLGADVSGVERLEESREP